jgi:hypothetical protein
VVRIRCHNSAVVVEAAHLAAGCTTNSLLDSTRIVGIRRWCGDWPWCPLRWLRIWGVIAARLARPDAGSVLGVAERGATRGRSRALPPIPEPAEIWTGRGVPCGDTVGPRLPSRAARAQRCASCCVPVGNDPESPKSHWPADHAPQRLACPEERRYRALTGGGRSPLAEGEACKGLAVGNGPSHPVVRTRCPG